jgi:hypothetical protein
MRTTIVLLFLGLAGTAMVAVPAEPSDNDLSFTTSGSSEPILTCDELKMSFWDKHQGDVVNTRRDQTVAISQKASTPLRIVAPTRGGIRVQPSPDGSYSALICEVAAASSRASAEAILDGVQASAGGGALTVTGPSSGNWGCYVVLSVPRGVVLNLSAENGELAVRDVEGQFELRTENGPISLSGVSGTVDARARNGPIEIKGHSGDIELRCENGPVGVKLDQTTWEGRGLTASTQNGPIRVELPKDIKTGVRVQGTDNSPVKWGGWSGDHWGIDDEDGSKVFRFGSEPTKVRVSTINGPIEIKASGGRATKGTKRI